jgi:3-oxoacyl-[acyl-carrier protein] reductase
MQGSGEVPIYPDLAGKVAVVTGGSGGIGAATCRLLAANGAKVAINGRDQARIDTVVDAIRASGGQAIGAAGDCSPSWAGGGHDPGRSPTSLRRTGARPWMAA